MFRTTAPTSKIPEEIVGARIQNNRWVFLMKWRGVVDPVVMTENEAYELYPLHTMKFMEKIYYRGIFKLKHKL